MAIINIRGYYKEEINPEQINPEENKTKEINLTSTCSIINFRLKTNIPDQNNELKNWKFSK